MTTEDNNHRAAHRFRIGDRVIRRPGTLGNMDGNGDRGTVIELVYKGVHPCLRVGFSTDRVETFEQDTYIIAE